LPPIWDQWGILGVVEGEGGGGSQQATLTRLGRIQLRPELRGQLGAMGFQGLPEDGQRSGIGAEQPHQEEIHLRGIDRQEGETGVEMGAAGWV
jgi:hypothetical protein